MTESISTANEVIDALGGTTAVAKMLKRKPQQVTNWRSDGRFPPSTFLALTGALEGIGKAAPTVLWGMEEAYFS